MTFKRVTSFCCFVIATSLLLSCGGPGGSSANSIIPAAQAQTPTPIKYWGKVWPSSTSTLVSIEAIAGTPGNTVAIPVAMPSSGTTIKSLEGNISLATECQVDGALVRWQVDGVYVFDTILKATPQTPVNIPIHFDTPIPVGSKVTLVIGESVSGCPSGSGSYFTNGGTGAPLSDAEVQVTVSTQ